MLEELEKLFSSIVKTNSFEGFDTDGYHWFRMEDGEFIGLPADELNERELALLHHIASPVSLPNGNSTDTAWYQLLHEEAKTDGLIQNPLYADGCRFIFFDIEGQAKAESFREAMDNLTENPLAFIWFTKHTGLIIESRQKEPIHYEEVVDMLMYDLSASIRLFISPWLPSVEDAAKQYEWLLKAYQRIPSHASNHVLYFKDTVPQLMHSLLSKSDRQHIAQHILQGLDEDNELLRTVRMYFACNQNLTLTAKKLYIHRNSLNYRLDKLTEKTGLDIRKFQDAFALYLAIHSLP
ncbi:PucR C-terminal helix-turn-helix domain-containing protein [Terribacillus halophilus]|uniref:PucR C-terminal helix-turn-helix domain-containing protein n=1 Tax=Terribacillus halophilus TaxID=361279 RepID=A0A1G6P996_9BACI|nr:helix-turn-helix domain-containing protein [Terribacillus halophilus]SDC76561.1 PucR C-terminal helix-turn-helix domain-containing protein [Terribacillus halophilus]